MISKATSKLEDDGHQDRIEIVHGSISDVHQNGFDGGTSHLLAHFIPTKDKENLYEEIFYSINPGGRLVVVYVCAENHRRRCEEFIST